MDTAPRPTVRARVDALAGYGILALFAVFLAKESGLPVPIPSDLLMIAAGVQAATGAVGLGELAVAVVVAVAVGQSVQFLAFRGAGRRILERFGPKIGLDASRLEAIAAKLLAGGPMSIFVGLNLPGARAGVIAAAGLAGFSYAAFAPAATAGTAVFHAWHIALGYAVGPAAVDMLERVGLKLVVAVVALAVLGALGWLVLRHHGGGKASRVRQWSEAACPACLASTLIDRRALW
jgi:membrane protein DedA with SNARE-associated domain